MNVRSHRYLHQIVLEQSIVRLSVRKCVGVMFATLLTSLPVRGEKRTKGKETNT